LQDVVFGHAELVVHWTESETGYFVGKDSKRLRSSAFSLLGLIESNGNLEDVKNEFMTNFCPPSLFFITDFLVALLFGAQQQTA
jgi:hypothetical protein